MATSITIAARFRVKEDIGGIHKIAIINLLKRENISARSKI
jgi:hypothetical protein